MNYGFFFLLLIGLGVNPAMAGHSDEPSGHSTSPSGRPEAPAVDAEGNWAEAKPEDGVNLTEALDKVEQAVKERHPVGEIILPKNTL